MIFTLHYAHEYYRPSGGPQSVAEGLDFRGDRIPDYWDFLSFATRSVSPAEGPMRGS